MASTPLAMVAYRGTVAQLEEALRQVPSVQQQPDGDSDRSYLHWAAAGGNEANVDALLALPAHAATVNTPDEAGYTPLLSAVAGGHLQVAKNLLASGATATVRTSTGATAMHLHKGRAAMVELLLGVAPATKNVRDLQGVTPLHRAAGPGFLDAARALLAAGARADVADKSGNTPLHYACEEDRPEMVTLLLEHGADALATNEEGKTGVQVAPKWKGERVIAAFAAARGVASS
jgi:26S proteasome non-ATPase regulatory subunit 10